VRTRLIVNSIRLRTCEKKRGREKERRERESKMKEQ
jgi:hypothetical protein